MNQVRCAQPVGKLRKFGSATLLRRSDPERQTLMLNHSTTQPLPFDSPSAFKALAWVIANSSSQSLQDCEQSYSKHGQKVWPYLRSGQSQIRIHPLLIVLQKFPNLLEGLDTSVLLLFQALLLSLVLDALRALYEHKKTRLNRICKLRNVVVSTSILINEKPLTWPTWKGSTETKSYSLSRCLCLCLSCAFWIDSPNINISAIWEAACKSKATKQQK